VVDVDIDEQFLLARDDGAADMDTRVACSKANIW